MASLPGFANERILALIVSGDFPPARCSRTEPRSIELVRIDRDFQSTDPGQFGHVTCFCWRMNISVVAFAVMAAVTILFLAATVLIEWSSRFQTKISKRDFSTVRDPHHPAAVMEYPIVQPGQSPESGAESILSNS